MNFDKTLPSRDKANLRSVPQLGSKPFAHNYRFPSEKSDRVVFVLIDIGKALRDDCNITLREMFYAAPKIFGSKDVDTTVNDVSCFIGCDRSELNIIAANNGLVAGNLKYILFGER